MNYYIIPGLKTEMDITEDMVIDAVCAYYGTTREYIFNPSREKNRPWYRGICAYLIRLHTKSSLSTIAKKFGYKHHTTVLSHCSKMRDILDVDVTVMVEMNQITELLFANQSIKKDKLAHNHQFLSL